MQSFTARDLSPIGYCRGQLGHIIFAHEATNSQTVNTEAGSQLGVCWLGGMGAEQSSARNGGAAPTTSTPRKTCYYELLGIEHQATEDE